MNIKMHLKRERVRSHTLTREARKVGKLTGNLAKKICELFTEGRKIGAKLYYYWLILCVIIGFVLLIALSKNFNNYDGFLLAGIVLCGAASLVWVLRNIDDPRLKTNRQINGDTIIIRIVFLKRLMGFFQKPTATFRQSKDEPFSTALVHFILVLATFFVINLIVYQIPASAVYQTFPDITSSFLITLSNGFYWVFVGIVVYAGLIAVCSENDAAQTAKVIAYSASPLAFFAFIPVVGPLWSLWGLGLVYLGVKEFFGLSGGRTLFAAIVLPVIATVLVLILFSTYWPEINIPI